MRLALIKHLGLAGGTLLFLACGGADHRSGDRAGTENLVLTVSPAQASLAPGQSLQFSATSPWGKEVVWAVLPPSAGTMTPGGVFTASTSQGPCTVVARLAQDIRYAGTATATVLPPPAPPEISPDVVPTSGANQASASGTLQHTAVVGEPHGITQVSNAAQTDTVRHGFNPPVK